MAFIYGAGDHERAGINRSHLASDAITRTRRARSPQPAQLPSAPGADSRHAFTLRQVRVAVTTGVEIVAAPPGNG